MRLNATLKALYLGSKIREVLQFTGMPVKYKHVVSPFPLIPEMTYYIYQSFILIVEDGIVTGINEPQ